SQLLQCRTLRGQRLAHPTFDARAIELRAHRPGTVDTVEKRQTRAGALCQLRGALQADLPPLPRRFDADEDGLELSLRHGTSLLQAKHPCPVLPPLCHAVVSD